MKNKKVKRIVAMVLVILLLPLYAIQEEGASASFVWLQKTYETGLSLFQLSDMTSYDRARNVFAEAGNYADSNKYVHYIDATKALETEDYESAAIIFQVLGDVGFLDAERQYEYTQARRAEIEGSTKSAMILYARSGVRDAAIRLDALRNAHPEIDITKVDLPVGAREGGFAYVMEDNLPAMNEPGGLELLYEFPMFEAVETLTFAHDTGGDAWAGVPIKIEEIERKIIDETETGYLRVNSLHIMTEAEEANYQEALQAAPLPPTDHYGRITTGGVHIRPEAYRKSGSNGEVKRNVIVELFGEVTGDDGEQWFRLMTMNGVEGYLQARYIEELNPEEDTEHRALIGRIPPPVPRTTPMPVAEPTALPVSRSAIVVTPMSYFIIPATTNNMTDREKYDLALFLLASGNPAWLPEGIALLRELEGYQNAKIYLPLAELLLLVERGDFDDAERSLNELYRDSYFNWGAIGSALEIGIPAVDDIYLYIQGRRAEANGQFYLAIGWYDTLNMWDSVTRMALLGMEFPAPTAEDAVNGKTPGDRVKESIFTDDPNESGEICARTECAYLPPHAAWLCGHCRFTVTDQCMRQCVECEDFLCAENDLAHEKICDICGAYDCTDTHGGIENHGWGKCRQSRPKATPAPAGSGVNTSGSSYSWSGNDDFSPFKNVDSCVVGKCTCTECKHIYGFCPCNE